MKSFFDIIQWVHENILMALHDLFRSTELDNWWIANVVNWAICGVITYYIVYWTKQLQLHKDNNEENQDTTAHSFLK